MKSSSTSIINWNNIIKKEARSITNHTYLGSIQGLYEPFIVVEEKGVLKQKRYFIPKNLLEAYDDIAVYFRTEAINSISITKKEEQEEILRKNQSTIVLAFNRTRLPVKKAKEKAIELKEVLDPVDKVSAAAAGRIINLLGHAMKFTNSFGLTVWAKIKGSTTSKGELKGIPKRLLKLVVKKNLSSILRLFSRNSSNFFKER